MSRKPARSLHHPRSNTLGFALFIGAIVVLLVVAGIAIKIFLVFRASSFDGKQQFSLEVQEGSETRFFVFTPSDSSIHTLLFQGSISSSPELSLGIPVDASLTSSQDISTLDSLSKVLLFDRQKSHATTTIVDGVNLFIFSHTANGDKFLSDNASTATDTTTQDSVFTKIFTDPTIYKEGESVAVVNGTDISGLGSEVGRLLTHLGANVVSVTTSTDGIPTSQVAYVGSLSYTASRISHLLKLPLMPLSNSAVSDITVTLGADFSDKFR